MQDMPPSKTAVRNAGSFVREHRRGECSDTRLEEAKAVITRYRAQFAEPLVEAHERLRKIHVDLNMQGEPSQQVTQRLKKAPTILSKLVREEGLNMSRMQDIGGCRMVVESIEHVRLVEQAVKDAWGNEVDHVRDYITTPRSSGYRAIHIVVLQSGLPIEIQLRNERMHSWAQLVEAFSGIASENFKQDGGHVIQDLLRSMSLLDEMTDAGQEAPAGLLDKLGTLTKEVSMYLNASLEARKDTT